jgi:hypothetical protein
LGSGAAQVGAGTGGTIELVSKSHSADAAANAGAGIVGSADKAKQHQLYDDKVDSNSDGDSTDFAYYPRGRNNDLSSPIMSSNSSDNSCSSNNSSCGDALAVDRASIREYINSYEEEIGRKKKGTHSASAGAGASASAGTGTGTGTGAGGVSALTSAAGSVAETTSVASSTVGCSSPPSEAPLPDDGAVSGAGAGAGAGAIAGGECTSNFGVESTSLASQAGGGAASVVSTDAVLTGTPSAQLQLPPLRVKLPPLSAGGAAGAGAGAGVGIGLTHKGLPKIDTAAAASASATRAGAGATKLKTNARKGFYSHQDSRDRDLDLEAGGLHNQRQHQHEHQHQDDNHHDDGIHDDHLHHHAVGDGEDHTKLTPTDGSETETGTRETPNTHIPSSGSSTTNINSNVNSNGVNSDQALESGADSMKDSSSGSGKGDSDTGSGRWTVTGRRFRAIAPKLRILLVTYQVRHRDLIACLLMMAFVLCYKCIVLLMI